MQRDMTADEYFSHGNSYFRQKEYPLAIFYYSKAIKKDPGHTRACRARGNVYTILAKYDNAISDLTYSIQQDQNDPKSYFCLGNVYEHKGNFEEAISYFSLSIKKEEKAFVYCRRGDLYEEQNRDDLAIADYTRAIELEPGNVKSYIGRSILYRKKEFFDLAIIDLAMALEIEPDNINAIKKLKIILSRVSFDNNSICSLPRPILFNIIKKLPETQQIFLFKKFLDNGEIIHFPLLDKNEKIILEEVRKDYNKRFLDSFIASLSRFHPVVAFKVLSAVTQLNLCENDIELFRQEGILDYIIKNRESILPSQYRPEFRESLAVLMAKANHPDSIE
jgi:tetratricopeptide (TPR) repeat protein